MNIILRRRGLGATSCNGIAAAADGQLLVVRNDNLHLTPENPADFCFRWGCTSTVRADVIVNTARSIHWCADKRQGRLDMQAAGVPVPETWTLENFTEEDRDDELYVIRPPRHAQGRHLRVASNDDIAAGTPPMYEGGYVSRLIDKVAEYRVFVCQNRVVWVVRKTPGNPNDVAWNVARGGRFDNVRWSEWPLQVVKAALAAAKVSGTDFCGVDVMVDAQDNPYVLEVNSAPSQTSEYRQSCVGKAFKYIIENGKAHFKDPEVLRSWKSVIHPALWSGASS